MIVVLLFRRSKSNINFQQYNQIVIKMFGKTSIYQSTGFYNFTLNPVLK